MGEDDCSAGALALKRGHGQPGGRFLDEAVAGFHRRPLTDHYPVLMLDGVVLRAGRGGGLPAPVHR